MRAASSALRSRASFATFGHGLGRSLMADSSLKRGWIEAGLPRPFRLCYAGLMHQYMQPFPFLSRQPAERILEQFLHPLPQDHQRGFCIPPSEPVGKMLVVPLAPPLRVQLPQIVHQVAEFFRVPLRLPARFLLLLLVDHRPLLRKFHFPPSSPPLF